MNSFRSKEKAETSFENIKDAVKGLYEILDLSLSEDDFYYEVGKDNITAIYKNLIELLLNESGFRQLLKKIQNSEVDLNIVLNEYLANV
ncbi:MAG TPA: hypothetical protein VMV43_05820 [Candidatus Nanopelagicaceae bacterium]|jgi:hypothetical protein|nr:hypothetical protein [Candidatus Nanopelagicaceae bacterium]